MMKLYKIATHIGYINAYSSKPPHTKNIIYINDDNIGDILIRVNNIESFELYYLHLKSGNFIYFHEAEIEEIK